MAATPTFAPAASGASDTRTITISSTTPGMTFRYTTDGSTPTNSYGTVGTSVSVSTNCSVKAICYGSGYQDSAVGSAAYTITVATPSFDKGAGTYSGNQTVNISCATAGVTTRYTTDGSAPTSAGNGTVGTSASIAGSCTLKAIAYRAGCTDSAVQSAAYTISKGSNLGMIIS